LAKLSLTDLANLTNESSVVAAINANNAAIEAAVEKTLSRDGTSPNSMDANLDMNSNRIQNLPAAVGDTEPVRKAEFDEIIDDVTAIYNDTANLYGLFDDRFLGAKSSAPSFDNDGNALVLGAIYYNTSLNRVFVYQTTGWTSIEPIYVGTNPPPNPSLNDLWVDTN
jgi:hypothetical protein